MASGVLTGTQMIKQKFVQKRVEQLTGGYMVTDAIFKAAPTDALSITYEVNADTKGDSSQVEERGELGRYPRIGMTTDEKSVMIKDYGLEVLISYNAVKYNNISGIDRAYLKLKNSVIKFVDGLGFQTLTDNFNAASTTINTQAAAAAWSDQTNSDPFADLMLAASKVNNNADESYIADVAVVNPQDYTNAMINKNFRQLLDTDVAPENKIAKKGVLVGQVGGLLLMQAHQMPQGSAWVGQREVVGDRNENTNGIQTDVYRDNNSQKAPYIATAFREFVDTLNEPKAGTLITGI